MQWGWHRALKFCRDVHAVPHPMKRSLVASVTATGGLQSRQAPGHAIIQPDNLVTLNPGKSISEAIPKVLTVIEDPARQDLSHHWPYVLDGIHVWAVRGPDTFIEQSDAVVPNKGHRGSGLVY